MPLLIKKETVGGQALHIEMFYMLAPQGWRLFRLVILKSNLNSQDVFSIILEFLKNMMKKTMRRGKASRTLFGR